MRTQRRMESLGYPVQTRLLNIKHIALGLSEHVSDTGNTKLMDAPTDFDGQLHTQKLD